MSAHERTLQCKRRIPAASWRAVSSKYSFRSRRAGPEARAVFATPSGKRTFALDNCDMTPSLSRFSGSHVAPATGTSTPSALRSTYLAGRPSWKYVNPSDGSHVPGTAVVKRSRKRGTLERMCLCAEAWTALGGDPKVSGTSSVLKFACKKFSPAMVQLTKSQSCAGSTAVVGRTSGRLCNAGSGRTSRHRLRRFRVFAKRQALKKVPKEHEVSSRTVLIAVQSACTPEDPANVLIVGAPAEPTLGEKTGATA